MRLFLAVGLVAMAAALSGGTPGASAVSGPCSKGTALQVAKPFFVFGGFVSTPIQQVLCGPFTGPGSKAMVVTFSAPTCWSPQGWAVFRLAGGDWRLVMIQRGEFIYSPLVAVGADLRETAPVFRQSDPRCVPSGGRHTRTWHWNGTRLVAGPWTQVKPASSPPPATGGFKSGYFQTPSGNIQCVFGYRGAADVHAFVLCGIKSGLKPPPPSRGPRCLVPNRVVVSHTGRASLAGPSACPGEPEGDAGPFGGGPSVSPLGYGKTWLGGGLSCTSAVTGLTCRNKSGHGFFLSRESWRLF
jgi:hypothetical protein